MMGEFLSHASFSRFMVGHDLLEHLPPSLKIVHSWPSLFLEATDTLYDSPISTDDAASLQSLRYENSHEHSKRRWRVNG
jgi:hypothetical protein